ncbi:hypothetical protein HYH03_009203 [Edaphochlamys debaryana]|uniref:Peptidase M11 gametolysin domain-containing protein n=1 Tax=Edaphochlamys debaryana TaxID=47281 RepID=A0A836BYP7_9CHLO|nr:hypothetical protein HYH03_009203 [Edaphochlamys debaryana]|eukprot:KAG2492538.1 hypothetical protein HYH03_009203 [Edaphochlamys debaryana]
MHNTYGRRRVAGLRVALAIAACCLAIPLQAAAETYTATGLITLVDTSYTDGSHASDRLLTADEGGIFVLLPAASADQRMFEGLISGGRALVTSDEPPVLGKPWHISSLTITTSPPPPMPPSPPPRSRPPPGSKADSAGDDDDSIGGRTYTKRAATWISNWNPGVILDQDIPDPPRVVRDLPTLFILLDLCGKGGGPATTETGLANMLFYGLTPFADYVATCSYGKATFDASNSRILTVKLPCSGVSKVTKMAWDSSSCTKDNLFNWMYEVEYYIDNVLKPLDWNHRRYRHHVIITPRNMTQWAGPACDWSGMGSIGMAQSTWSYAWVSGDSWQQKQVYLHEMGHNYNLMHAATLENGGPDACSHCDWSSAMGYCCDTRCLSPPHAYQLGWAKALATVNDSQLTTGTTLAFELPSQIMSDANYLQVTTTWLGADDVAPSAVAAMGGTSYYYPPNATFLFSYRLDFEDFDELPGGFSGGVNVYLFTIGAQDELKDSVHLGLISPSSPSWADPSGSLVVRQLTGDANSVILTLCRPEAASEAGWEACNDFNDNDCDGLIDADDPDCAAFFTNRPPPPPPQTLTRSPPPPRPPPPPPRPRSPPPPLRSPPPPHSPDAPESPRTPTRRASPPPPPPRLATEAESPPPPGDLQNTGTKRKRPPPPPKAGGSSNGGKAPKKVKKKKNPPPPPPKAPRTRGGAW